MNGLRPTWAEVSLRVLEKNFDAIRQHVGPQVGVCAVVKADAYGHGAVECARALERAGAQWFGVTCTEEGVQLREAGIQGRILLMTGFWHGEEAEVIRKRLTPAVWEAWHLAALEKAAAANGGERVPVHLKVDTGMARLGVSMGELLSRVVQLKSSPHLVMEGLFSHLASAEVLDRRETAEQLRCFQAGTASVKAAGILPACCHVANSAAMASCPGSWKDMVRPGLALYGYYLPFCGAVDGRPPAPAVEPILTWKTRIISLRTLEPGQAAGYNATFVASRPSRIAALPVGYADGLSRQLSSRGRVIVRGQYAPIAGRVSMDLTLVDVTDVPGAEVGDEVVLIGRSGERCITADEHARLAGTLPYETLCNISKRVTRKYT